jgi:hypothetical protein
VSTTPNAEFSGGNVVRDALRSRFGVVFVALLVALVVPAALPDRLGLSLVFTLAISAVLLSGLYAVSDTRTHMAIGLAIMLPAFAVEWLDEVTVVPLEPLSLLLSMLFFGYLAWMMFIRLVVARRVDANVMFAAICVYMLIGFICGSGYYLIELLAGDPQVLTTLRGNLGIGLPRHEALYYSFVTLTTLGYGDIAPLAQISRSLAILEALFGQVYLVTLMARLVSLHVQDTSRAPASA